MKSMGLARLAAVAAVCLVLAGCSSLNPINWFRDATGASKNDPGPDARNTANLEAGGERPYPNLGTVPPPPTRALGTVERERLEKALTADRQNAKYTDDQLRAGQTASAPRPAPPRPAAARPEPQEASAPPAPAAAPPISAPAMPPSPPAATPPLTPERSPAAAPPISASPPLAPERPPAAAPAARVSRAQPLEAPAAAQAAPDTAAPSEPPPAAAAPPVPSRYETGTRLASPATPPEPTPSPAPPRTVAAAPPPPADAPAPAASAPAPAAEPAAPAAAPARPRSGRQPVEEPPKEAPLASPSVRSTPEPETPRPVPPPPAVATPAPARGPAPAARPAPVQEAALPPGAPVAELTFADGSAALDPGARAKLADVAAQQKRAGGNVRIIAHAAPGRGATGQLDAFGMALDRANAVASALAQAGVPATSILVEAAPPATGPAGRRAEIYLEP